MAETVLVTGGTGFIAGWCIVQLLERGYSVRTTVRDASKEQRVRAAVAGAKAATDRLSFATADLNSDEGWDAAVAGCEYVLHVASPLGGGTAGDRDALIAPARDGTLRVLRAAVKAGVQASGHDFSCGRRASAPETDQTSDETVWSDPDDPQFDAYRVSKILAERAAWDFMRRAGSTTQFTTILPGAVFGPILTAENLGSVQIIQGMLNGKPPALPRLGFWIVDVRDLADLHIRAMTAASAAGQRFIAAGEYMWMEDIARTLRTELGAAGRRRRRGACRTSSCACCCRSRRTCARSRRFSVVAFL